MSVHTSIQVLDPTTEAISASAVIAARPATLDGATVGLLANGKPNAGLLLSMVHEVLSDRFSFKRVAARDKGNSSRPCPDEMMREIADQCDVAITAIGD